MDKKVILISKANCMLCDRVAYELEYDKKVPFTEYSNINDPKIYDDFINMFKINRFPVIQIDDGKGFITIHRDAESTTTSEPDMEIIFCPTIEEMMETFDKAFAS